jgi:hypothetical protein
LSLILITPPIRQNLPTPEQLKPSKMAKKNEVLRGKAAKPGKMRGLGNEVGRKWPLNC